VSFSIVGFNPVGLGLKEFKRFQEVVRVFVKYGFGGVLSRISELGVRGEGGVQKLSEGVRLRLALSELGPTFIKLGQVLSTRSDFLPFEVIEELEKLQDEAAPCEYVEIKKIIEAEFGLKIDKIFKTFDKTPVASASIAQVHKATLKNGVVVAVKVQRPGVRESFETDLKILKIFAGLVEKYFPETARVYNPVLAVEEFGRSVERELDFRVEARNAERFRRNFMGVKSVVIPRVYKSFERVLVMDFIEGVKAKDLKVSLKRRRELASEITFFIAKEVFIDGFFNADPHQGNFIFYKSKIAMIDFGMVGFIDEDFKEVLAVLYVDLIQRDLSGFAENFVKIARFSSDSDLEGFKSEVNDFIEGFYGVTSSELEIGKILLQLTSIARRYKVSINPKFLVLAKVFISLEGLQKTLDPDFNVIGSAELIVKSIQKREASPSNVARKAVKQLSLMQSFLFGLPPKISQILDKAASGGFKMEVEHVGLEKPVYRIDRAVNKVSISMIIAALLVSSSLIILSKTGPLFEGFSVFGFAGLVLALILSFWLATVILIEGEV
jgi:ubiquinone biosynthesis protein